MKEVPNCESQFDEVCASLSDDLSEHGPAHGSTSTSSGKRGQKVPYFLLQKYEFLGGPRKRLAFLASDAVLFE
jgi:hypothetical protein